MSLGHDTEPKANVWQTPEAKQPVQDKDIKDKRRKRLIGAGAAGALLLTGAIGFGLGNGSKEAPEKKPGVSAPAVPGENGDAAANTETNGNASVGGEIDGEPRPPHMTVDETTPLLWDLDRNGDPEKYTQEEFDDQIAISAAEYPTRRDYAEGLVGSLNDILNWGNNPEATEMYKDYEGGEPFVNDKGEWEYPYKGVEAVFHEKVMPMYRATVGSDYLLFPDGSQNFGGNQAEFMDQVEDMWQQVHDRYEVSVYPKVLNDHTYVDNPQPYRIKVEIDRSKFNDSRIGGNGIKFDYPFELDNGVKADTVDVALKWDDNLDETAILGLSLNFIDVDKSGAGPEDIIDDDISGSNEIQFVMQDQGGLWKLGAWVH